LHQDPIAWRKKLEGLRVALYAREIQRREPDPEPFMYRIEKWEKLERVLSSEADAVAIALAIIYLTQ